MEAEELYKDAYNAHYKSGNTEKAIAGYQHLIELYPDSPEARYARSQLSNLEEDEERKRAAQDIRLSYEGISSYEEIHLTTSSVLEGYRVVETIDVISAECAFGMNIFRDLFAGVRDIVGGRSGTTQNVLHDARKKCLAELRQEAAVLKANAVIAVSLAYSEFSGKHKSMLFLVAYGTAVRVEKVETMEKKGIKSAVES